MNCKGNHKFVKIHSSQALTIQWCEHCGSIGMREDAGTATLWKMRIVKPRILLRVLTEVPAEILEWAKEIDQTA